MHHVYAVMLLLLRCSMFYGAIDAKTIYVAILLHNNEDLVPHLQSILHPRSFIGNSLIISIVESCSIDLTRARLFKWQQQVENSNTFQLYIQSPAYHSACDKSKKFRNATWQTSRSRVAYLSQLRNKALEPLHYLYQRRTGKNLNDVLIWLNDVWFQLEDLSQLIQDLSDYPALSAVCALDMKENGLYDRWVLRDRHGLPLQYTFPFYSTAQDQWRMIWSRDLSSVRACWSGLQVSRAHEWFGQVLTRQILRFRWPSFSTCRHSECFLICRDIAPSLHAQCNGLHLAVNNKVIVTYNYWDYWLWNMIFNWTTIRFIYGIFGLLHARWAPRAPFGTPGDDPVRHWEMHSLDTFDDNSNVADVCIKWPNEPKESLQDIQLAERWALAPFINDTELIHLE